MIALSSGSTSASTNNVAVAFVGLNHILTLLFDPSTFKSVLSLQGPGLIASDRVLVGSSSAKSA
jgi:hypothetical protein